MLTHGVVSFSGSHVCGGGRKIHVENAFVLSKVCMDMPVSPVNSTSQWKHLTGLVLADLEFGTPALVDLLLGADYYGDKVLHGWRWGPMGHALCTEDMLWMGPGRVAPIK